MEKQMQELTEEQVRELMAEEWQDRTLMVVVGQAWASTIVETLFAEELSITDAWADRGPTEAQVSVLWNPDVPFDSDDGLRDWIWQHVPGAEGISIATGQDYGI